MPALHLATFGTDVTPPVGHPLCGGWITPVRGVDDPLYALGVVLLGVGQPIVLCVADWVALRNDAHLAWREALARAAHTTPDRVTVHCVHQHNAPFADTQAERLIRAAPMPTSSLDLAFFDRVVADSARACQASLAQTQPWTHVGLGQAVVHEVASNRRIIGADGRARGSRTSATRDAALRAEPEGLIDPVLRTVSFWNERRPLVAMHYYATHPMSYYGDGRVSSDFCGLARAKRQADDRDVFQMYFTGCSGNITAGKYNDGEHALRPVLRDRIYAGMMAAWQATERHAVTEYTWRVDPVRLPPRTEASFQEATSRQVLMDPKQPAARRNNAAYQIAWLMRQNRPIDITCLDLGPAAIVHLPGEPFIQYQLFAQQQPRPARFIAVAGYGDDGCGYIPDAAGYLQGGYEPTVALAGPRSEAILHRSIRTVLGL